MRDDIEERRVSREELESGVTAKGGHRVLFLVGGLPGSLPAPDPKGPATGAAPPGDPTAPPGDPTAPPGDPTGGTATGPSAPPAAATGKLDLQIVSIAGAPQALLEVELTLPDRSKRAGKTDANGHFSFETPGASGDCALELPDLPAGDDSPPSKPERVRYKAGVLLAIGSAPVIELAPRVRRGTMTGMHFETNKTFLRPSAMTGIRQLRALYQSYGAVATLVTGHTDTVGAADYNRGLSEERAQSIADFLTDNADGWAANYGPHPHSAAWGVREDQQMLATLPQNGTPYYAGVFDGQAGGGTQAAYKRFQQDKGLAQSGRGDADTRRALVADYMALEGTSLPAGSTVLTHGCGLTHLAQPTGPNIASEANRRVEVFLFESKVDPPPQARCPVGGCAEFAIWVSQSSLTVDLDQPPGSVNVTVLNGANQPIANARVHAAGPVGGDVVTDASGNGAIGGLVPGDYKLIADADGLAAADGAATVASGAATTVTLVLRASSSALFDLGDSVASVEGGVDATQGAQLNVDQADFLDLASDNDPPVE